MLWLLLKNKIRIFFNGLFRDHLTKRRRKLISLAGGTLIFYFVYTWIFDIFSVLLTSQDQGIVLINSLLVIFFSGFLLFLFASGVTIAIHYLFVSSDLTLLLSSPLSNRTIFCYKLIESIFANSSFFIFLGAPIFVAYGVVTNAAWFYYPLMIVDVFIFLAFPICLSFLIAIGVVRLMPATRAKELMTAALGVLSIGIWFFLQIIRAAQLNPQSVEYHPERIAQIQQWSQMKFFPATYAANSLIAFSQMDARAIAENFIPMVLLIMLVFSATLLLSEKLFKEGLIGLSEKRVTKMFDYAASTALGSRYSNKEKTTRKQKPDEIPVYNIFSSVAGQIFLRDLKLLTRDFRHLTNVLILCAMMIIFPLTRASEITDSATELLLPFIPVMMLSAIASSQLASRLIPLEGKSFWMMLAAPQSWNKMLTGKFFVSFILNTIAVWAAIAIAGIYLHPPSRIIILLFFSSAALTWVMSVFGLVLGSIFSNFDWEHPKKMLTSGGGLLLAAGSFIFVGFWSALLTVLYTFGADFVSTLFLDMVEIVFGLLLMITTTIIGFRICTRKLSNLEWK